MLYSKSEAVDDGLSTASDRESAQVGIDQRAQASGQHSAT